MISIKPVHSPRFHLGSKHKDDLRLDSPHPVSNPDTPTKLKQFVQMLKEGPGASASTDTDTDSLTDAPLPRGKTRYERYLKKKVREAQIQKYNQMIEEEENKKEKVTSTHTFILRRNSSRKSLDSDDSRASSSLSKKVRFSDEIVLSE